MPPDGLKITINGPDGTQRVVYPTDLTPNEATEVKVNLATGSLDPATAEIAQEAAIQID